MSYKTKDSETFKQFQNEALKKELLELITISEHSCEILDVFLENTKELDADDRKYVTLIAKQLRDKLNNLKII